MSLLTVSRWVTDLAEPPPYFWRVLEHIDEVNDAERLRTEILAVINSFDNRDFSATPDQRDVIDPIRRVLNKRKAS